MQHNHCHFIDNELLVACQWTRGLPKLIIHYEEPSSGADLQIHPYEGRSDKNNLLYDLFLHQFFIITVNQCYNGVYVKDYDSEALVLLDQWHLGHIAQTRHYKLKLISLQPMCFACLGPMQTEIIVGQLCEQEAACERTQL